MSRDVGATSDPIPAGKVPVDLLNRLLASDHPLPGEVRLGPAIGEDACAIDVDTGVLIAATDPITLTAADLGRSAVIVNANDVAVMGTRPRWFLAAVLLPLGTADRTIEQLFTSMRTALDEVGATLVGGHTEITPAVTQPVIVGQMLGLATDGHIVTTAGAKPGGRDAMIGESCKHTSLEVPPMPPLTEPTPIRVHDPIRRLVASKPVAVAEKLTLRAVAAVLAAVDIGAALVQLDDGSTGIVSERDVARALADDADPDVIWSADVMTEDLVTADADEPILQVALRMIDEGIRHIGVVAEGRIAGVVSARDVFAVFAEEALEVP